MAKVLKCDASVAAAYVERTFTPTDEVWISFDLLYLAAALADWTGPGAFADWANVLNSPSDNTRADLGIEDASPDHLYFIDHILATEFVTTLPTADAWHTYEIHWNKGDVVELYVSGSLAASFPETTNQQAHDLILGMISTSQNDADSVLYVDNIKVGTVRGGSTLFSEDFEGATPLANFDFTSGDVSVADDPSPSPVPPAVHGPPSYEWRFVVTKLNLRVLTYLDRLARDKNVTYALNRPAVATGVVPSDHPEINLVQSDGFPALDEGVRCLLGFRREGGDPPWLIRFAGIIEQLEDNVNEDAGAAPFSTYTAYDPRQYLYRRPIRKADGSLPGPNGLSFSLPGNEIALALLARTLAADGEHHIKVAGGSVETTDVIDITFQQGASVGEAWDQLCETGNIDIILTALYDPVGSPSKLATFNCYSLAGTVRHKAVMAWDKPSRSLVGVNRLKDGDQRANRLQYYYGQGGPRAGGVVSDFAAAAQYGDYWAQQFFPGKSASAVELLAAEQLLLRARGMRTYRLNPTPGSLGQTDSPLVFLDYFLGDTLPIFASSRLRHSIAVGKRVIGVPIAIDDDGQERIADLSLGEGEEEVS